ncbi:DUF86 domain-containing protein [Olsenella phocaeensis]|uniref:HepT-like ribonuclease domain-containing protein n=1 Tax=Olsenella phocaeensis TaxID=1852385 RepID=UPI003A920651
MNDSDRRNLERALEFADELASTLVERDILISDRFVQWAITTPLYNVGEFVSHVSKELRASHPEIPWSKVAGTRHRLVHDYGGTDWTIVTEIVYRGLPSFADQIRGLLR